MQTGRSSKRSRQREQLILAVLQQPTLVKAAASIGISTVQAWRIGKTPEFQQELSKALREDDLQLLGRLQYGSSSAVSAMLNGLVDKHASDAALVRTANGVLEQSAKAQKWERRAVRGGPESGKRWASMKAPSPKRSMEDLVRPYRSRHASASTASQPVRTAKKRRQWDQLILALLQQPILAKAAASIHMSQATAGRISKTPEFQEEYGAACREDFSRNLARLAHARRGAVGVLHRVINAPNTSQANRERAAHCHLDQTRKAMERAELAPRAGTSPVDRGEPSEAPARVELWTLEEIREVYEASTGRKLPPSVIK